MIITCPHCKSSKDVGDVSIPKNGVTATCSNCRGQFSLLPEAAPKLEPPKFDVCPACGFSDRPRGGGDICPKCGLVYSKYLARLDHEALRQESLKDIESTSSKENLSLIRVLTKKRFFALVGVVLIAAWIRFGHDWKFDKNYLLKPGKWQGEMSFRGKQHPFLLAIQTTDDGKLEGYMDWTETMPRYRLAVRGTHKGNHLLFEDYKFLEGSGEYGLNDKKDVYIIDNEMNGTDKNGSATLHAVQVATSPDPAIELRKY